jgi:hypothetical protein
MDSAPELFRPLDSRARLVAVFFWCYIAASAALIVAIIASAAIGVNLYSEESYPAEETPAGIATLMASGIIIFLCLIIYVICIVVYLMWLYRARSNLPALGAADVRWSPRWSIAWWFIPIMSLFRPYQVVKETWQASDPAALPTWRRDSPPPLFPWWWTLFLIDNIGSNVTDRMSRGLDRTPSFDAAITFTYIDVAVLIAGIGAALCAIRIVRDITQRQIQRYQIRAFA